MKNKSNDQKSKGEKTFVTSLLLSATGPIFTGISVILSFSTTQIADFLRRSTELAALFISWRVYRKIQRNKDMDEAEQLRLERMANLGVGYAMACSGAIMFVIAAFRFSQYEPNGNVAMGLVIAVLGLLTNTWFWFRYRSMMREQFNAVIASQQKLYRTKSFVDLCVVTVLTTVAIAPANPITKSIDILGSVVIACYLLWSGLSMIWKK